MYFYHFVSGTCVERTAVESSILTCTRHNYLYNLQNLKKSGFENREKYFFLEKNLSLVHVCTCMYVTTDVTCCQNRS